MDEIDLRDVISAYCMGYFPMADSRDSDEFYWFDPQERGQLDIAGLHIPAKLRKTVLKAPYTITVDMAFDAVIDGCAATRTTQDDTWINPAIRNIFVALHEQGLTHSVEAWHDGHLVGGLYGLAIGGVFCGESMFSRARDASKICLVHLCARLWRAGFQVLDTQYVNDHLKQFGCYTITAEEYRTRLETALPLRCDFRLQGDQQTTEMALVRDYLANR